MTTNGTALVMRDDAGTIVPVRDNRYAPDNRFALEPRSFEDGMRLAKVIVQSGMFGVKNEADAFVRISTGVSLGLSAVQSLRGIYVINGKAGVSADLLMALALQSPECEYFRMVESTTTRATFTAKRRSDSQPITLSFTIDDAKTAGLTSNAMYAKYPAQMLRARCIAGLARLAFPERCHGLFTPDEIKTGDTTGEDIPYGEIVEEPTHVAPVQAAPAPKDFAKLVHQIGIALDASHSADQIEALSAQAKDAFKGAPRDVRETVAAMFRAARERIQNEAVEQEAAAE